MPSNRAMRWFFSLRWAAFAAALALPACATHVAEVPAVTSAPVNYAPEIGSALTTYTVTRPAGAGKKPAVLLLHGGGWAKGEPQQMDRYIPHILASGWVAINAGYRLAPEHLWPAQRDDLHALFGHIAERADELGIDPQRIAVLGYSAGAHLGLVAGTSPNPRVPRPAALVLGAGPYDLRGYTNSPLVRTFLGGSPSMVGPAIYSDASPFARVDAQTPPTYLWHGTWDLTVGIEQSRNLAKSLARVDVPHTLRERFGRGHITNFLIDADQWAEIDTFLRPYLAPAKR